MKIEEKLVISNVRILIIKNMLIYINMILYFELGSVFVFVCVWVFLLFIKRYFVVGVMEV